MTVERDPVRAIRSIVASYDDPVIRLYSRVRFTILRQVFLEEIGQYLPREGRVALPTPSAMS